MKIKYEDLPLSVKIGVVTAWICGIINVIAFWIGFGIGLIS